MEFHGESSRSQFWLDVTGEREKEARFTRVGGVSFSTPERKLLDANPRLVEMLGWANKDELLGDRCEVSQLLGCNCAWPRGQRSGWVQIREVTLRPRDGKVVN